MKGQSLFVTAVLALLTTTGTSICAQINLKAQSIRSSRKNWLPEQRQTVTISLQNASNIPVTGVTCGIYLSPDSSISNKDRLLLRFKAPTLQSFATYNKTLSFDIPLHIRGGRHYVGLFVDHLNSIRESRELDNATAVPITVVEKPDLRVTKLKQETPATAARPVKITYTVKNYGAKAALNRGVATALYLSPTSVLGSASVFLGIGHLSHVMPGESRSQTVSVHMPAHVPADRMFLFAVTDHGNWHPESIESNNQLSTPTKIALADLKLRRLEFRPFIVTPVRDTQHATLSSKASATCYMSLTNRGGAKSPYLLVLSRSRQFAIDDTTLTGLSYLNSSFFPRWLGTLDAGGHAFPRVFVRSGMPSMTVYVHAFFNGSLAEPADRPLRVDIQ